MTHRKASAEACVSGSSLAPGQGTPYPCRMQISPLEALELAEGLVAFIECHDPYGYADCLEIDETEAEAVGEMYQDLISGNGISGIIQYLNTVLEEPGTEQEITEAAIELLYALQQFCG